MSDVGGFCVFISAVLGIFVNCVNEKMYRKLLAHDSFQVKFNKDYLCIPEINPNESSRFKMFSKKKPAETPKGDDKKEKDKETKPEDKDKSDGETAAEGGNIDGHFIIEMGDDFEGGDNVS